MKITRLAAMSATEIAVRTVQVARRLTERTGLHSHLAQPLPPLVLANFFAADSAPRVGSYLAQLMPEASHSLIREADSILTTGSSIVVGCMPGPAISISRAVAIDFVIRANPFIYRLD